MEKKLYQSRLELRYGVEDFKLLQFVEEVLIPLFQQVKKVQEEMDLIIAESKTKPYVKLDYKL